MRAPRTLIVQVAPWDWPFVPWQVESWLPVVNDVLLCYERFGYTYTSEEPLFGGRDLAALAEHARDAISQMEPRKTVRTLTYEMPPRDSVEWGNPLGKTEVYVRNLASFSCPWGSVLLSADCDEALTNPDELGEWLDRHLSRRNIGRDIAGGIWATYHSEVLKVEGDRALVVGEQRRCCIGSTRPGGWAHSRAVNGEQLDSPARLMHWRLKAQDIDQYRDYHMNAGHEAWRRSLPVGPLGSTLHIPEGKWSSDALLWRTARVVPVSELGYRVPPNAEVTR